MNILTLHLEMTRRLRLENHRLRLENHRESKSKDIGFLNKCKCSVYVTKPKELID